MVKKVTKKSKPKDVKKAPKEPNAAQKVWTLTKSGVYTSVKKSKRVFLTKQEYDKLK